MGKLDMSAMNQVKTRLESQGGSNVGFAKLAQGKNIIRVLQPKGDKTSFFTEGFVHFGLGADGKKMVTCLKTFDEHERCPVCEYVEQLQRSRDAGDKKLADRIKRKKRIYINILSRDDDSETKDEPKVLPIGVTVLKGLLDTICDPDYRDITDFEHGRDVTINRKGQMLKTEYSVIPKPNESPASTVYSEEELDEKMADLDSLFRKQSYDELSLIINGDDDGGESNEPEIKGVAKKSSGNMDYDEMEPEELLELCEKRGIEIPEKANKLKIITLLSAYDEESNGNEDDDVMDSITAAIEARKNKK